MLALGATLGASGQEVIPDFYRDPGIYPNRTYVNQNFNEHIDPFNGALQHHYVDMFLPGNGGFDIKVARSYNSSSIDPVNPAAYESQIGLGWSMHFGRVLKAKDYTVCLNTNPTKTTDNPVLELQDGSRQILAFTGSSSPLMLSTQRWRVDCIPGGTGGVAVYSPDGVRYDMTQMVNVGSVGAPIYAWYTTKIADRNGNTATITYLNSSSPQVTTLVASDGRTINFAYADSGSSAARITSVTASGYTYYYGYTAISGVSSKYFLTSVTRPDGLKWQYVYNSSLGPTAGSYVMKSATYPQGGTINYGYQYVYFDTAANPYSRSQVISTKSLSSGGSWAFSYSPGSAGNYDTTTVTTPSGSIVYKHIGPNYSTAGTVWMVGLLKSKSIGSIQTEEYTWGKQKISSESFSRPGAFVIKVDNGEVNAPLLTGKTIRRNGATHSTNYSGFDSYGNPGSVSESGPNGGARSTTLTYHIDTSKWIINKVKNESYTGSSVVRVFDGKGNLTSVSRDGVTTGYSYDGQGNIQSATFPRNLTHTYSGYKRGTAQTENQREGITIRRVVSDAGNVTEETDGDGHTTKYYYDGLNRLTGIDYPVGNKVTISYAATSKTAKRGFLEEVTTNNGFGYVTAVTLGGIARTYSVDALGRRTFESNPGASIGTRFDYDILDRVTKVTNSDNSARYLNYGAASKSVRDERNFTTTFTYRGYGDPEQMFLMSISPDETSAAINISRNWKDLIGMISQGGKSRYYNYNANYYLISIDDPESGVTSFSRDAAGNMTSRRVGASSATNYVYDEQNRLTDVNYPSGTPSIKNVYNKRNGLTSSSSVTGSRTVVYDANGNLTSESISVDGATGTLIYGYNGNDQLSSVQYPSGNVVAYLPDALGRPTQVTGVASAVQYWPSGQLKSINYVNGVTTAYGQNARLWPATVGVQRSGLYLLNSAYGYDGAGNLTSISDSSDASRNRTLIYDGINRLTGAAGPWGAGTIRYDGAGNILSQSLGAYGLSYAYSASNRLLSVSGSVNSSFSYDVYANISAGLGNTYSYDDVPNLRCVNCANSSSKIEYTYDGTNRRISATRAGVKTYEIYDSRDNLMLEFIPSTGKLTEYIYLGGRRVAQRVTP